MVTSVHDCLLWENKKLSCSAPLSLQNAVALEVSVVTVRVPLRGNRSTSEIDEEIAGEVREARESVVPIQILVSAFQQTTLLLTCSATPVEALVSGISSLSIGEGFCCQKSKPRLTLPVKPESLAGAAI